MEPRFAGGGKAAVGTSDRAGVILNPPADVLLTPGYFTKSKAQHALENVDMTPSRFNQAINFETLAGRQREEPPPAAISAEEHQQQVVEQARLLASLRAQQREQEEMLRRQQQEDLARLMGDHEKAKHMARQRKQTYGGAGNAQLPPQGFPSGRSAAAVNHRSPPPSQAAVQQHNNTTPTKPKIPAGRPVPVIPSVASTPAEYREHGNPELDSTIASVDHEPPPAPPLNHHPPPQPSKFVSSRPADCGSEFGAQSPRKTLDFSNLTLMSEQGGRGDGEGEGEESEGEGGRQGSGTFGGLGLGGERNQRNQAVTGIKGVSDSYEDTEGHVGIMDTYDDDDDDDDDDEGDVGPLKGGELSITEQELLKLIHEAGITDEATIVALLRDQLGKINLTGSLTSTQSTANSGYYGPQPNGRLTNASSTQDNQLSDLSRAGGRKPNDQKQMGNGPAQAQNHPQYQEESLQRQQRLAQMGAQNNQGYQRQQPVAHEHRNNNPDPYQRQQRTSSEHIPGQTNPPYQRQQQAMREQTQNSQQLQEPYQRQGLPFSRYEQNGVQTVMESNNNMTNSRIVKEKQQASPVLRDELKPSENHPGVNNKANSRIMLGKFQSRTVTGEDMNSLVSNGALQQKSNNKYTGYVEEDDVIIEGEESGSVPFNGYQCTEGGRYMTEGYPTSSMPSIARPMQNSHHLRTVNRDSDEEEEEGSYVDQEEEEEDYEETQEEELEDEDHNTEDVKNHDDRPVAGLGGKKTFEQLLEEELRKEQASAASSKKASQTASKSGGVFLRKGEGIARFGMRGKKSAKPPPSKKPSTTVKEPPTRNTKEPVKTTAKNLPPKVPRKTSANPKPAPKSNPKDSSNQIKRKIGKSDVNSTSSRPLDTVAEISNGAASTEDAAKSDGESSKTDATGDVSFYKVLQKTAKEEKIEEAELDEFELLEQYADDNASFLSNVSAVNRVLTQHKKAKPPAAENTNNKGRRMAQHNSSSSSSSDSDSDSDATTAGEMESDMDDTLKYASPDTRKPFSADGRTPTNGEGRGDEGRRGITQSLKPVNRKVSAMDKRSPPMDNNTRRSMEENNKPSPREHSELNTNRNNKLSGDSGSNTANTDSTNSNPASNSNSTSSLTSTATMKHMVAPSQGSDQNRGQNPSQGQKNHSRNNATAGHPLRTRPPDSDSDDMAEILELATEDIELNLGEGEEEEEEEDEEDDMDFCDSEVWDDNASVPAVQYSALSQAVQTSLSQHAVTTTAAAPTAPVTKEIVDYTAGMVSSGSSIDTGANIPLLPAPATSLPDTTTQPPTSQLVKKLFPSLKPPASSQPVQKDAIVKQPAADGIASKMVRDKLAELETEIEKFRQENANLERIRKEREQGIEALKKDVADFEKQKKAELQRIKEFKEEETRKLKKERRVFEQYQKTSRGGAGRGEREELEGLRGQIEALQDELRRKEARWSSATARLRDRIDVLDTENTELKHEVAFLEKKRLEGWQAHDMANANNAAKNNQKITSSTFPPPAVKKVKSSVPPPSSKPTNSDAGRSKDKDHPHLRRHHKSPPPHDNLLMHNVATDTESDVGPEDSASNLAEILSRVGSSEEAQPLDKRPAAPTPQPERVAGAGRQPEPRKRAHIAHGRATVPEVDKGNAGEYEEIAHDEKVERIYNNGAVEILFVNGTRKQVSADGRTVIVSYFNGDVKQILPDHRVVYYYDDAQVTHTHYPDGLEALSFPSGQEEKHYPDGTREITFPDQTIKYLYPSKVEETVYPNGTLIKQEANGDTTLSLPNGQKEIHTKEYKRREYPDGTMKTIFPDGRQETLYANGRFRIKDKMGNLVMDKMTT